MNTSTVIEVAGLCFAGSRHSPDSKPVGPDLASLEVATTKFDRDRFCSQPNYRIARLGDARTPRSAPPAGPAIIAPFDPPQDAEF
jgi:hypothetical protein